MFSMTIWILGLLALSCLALHKFIIYPAFISPLAKIPNAHWSSPFSPAWILWTRYKGRENRTVHAAHLKHGPIVRLDSNEISVNDLDGLKKVYVGGFEKGEWYSIFNNYGVPCMFSSAHTRTHSARKRMLSNIYSKSSIHNSPALNAQGQIILYDRLLPLLSSSSNPQTHPNGINVHELWMATAMDFICAYIFGLKNGSNFLEDVTYRRHWLKTYYWRKIYTFFVQELPHLTRFLKKLHIHIVPTQLKDANDELEAWTKERCDATSAYIKKGSVAQDNNLENEPVVFNAMLSGIAKEERTKGTESVLANETLKYPELSIASEMLDQVAAGHETAGITLTYFSWQLSQNISLQDELRKELLGLEPNMSVSNPGLEKNMPNSKDLDALPLLNALLMETLRLRAAIPGAQPRVTPYPASTLGPYTIPGGVRVASSAHVLHRNEDVYPGPETFNHMRWMDDRNGYSEEQRRERDRWFWAFSSGGRMCVGSNFAMHEMKLITAVVWSNFRTYVVDDEGIEQVDTYTAGPKSNRLFLRFEKVVE